MALVGDLGAGRRHHPRRHRLDRKLNRKGRAFARRALDDQPPAVRFHNFADNREAQSRAFGFGRKERRADLVNLRRRNADSRVGKVYVYDVLVGWQRVATVSVPPCGIAWTALMTMFLMTCSI